MPSVCARIDFALIIILCTAYNYIFTQKIECEIILYLHRALNKVTQSANQHMHTFLVFL